MDEQTNKTVKVVWTVVDRGQGKSFWTRVGIGFVNRDGSLTLRLDAIPVNGTLQVREWEPLDRRAECHRRHCPPQAQTLDDRRLSGVRERDDAMKPLALTACQRALSRVAARVTGSRFAKPVARVVLAAAGLVLLAFVGQSAIAGAFAHVPPTSPSGATSAERATPSAEPLRGASPQAALTTAAGASAGSIPPTGVTSEPAPIARSPATPEDPVVLNTATEDDLRRLPGIGAKRAAAILALRSRLGRFRAIEDLLKVKGVGRATLKRLRPLVRLDPAGAPQNAGGATTAS